MRIQKVHIRSSGSLPYIEVDLGYTLAQWSKLTETKKWAVMDELVWRNMFAGMEVVDENGFEVDFCGNVKGLEGKFIYKNK